MNRKIPTLVEQVPATVAQHVAYPLVVGKVIGSNLGPTPLCQVRDINSKSRGNALPRNRRNSLPCTVRTSQTNFVQSKGWLSDGKMDPLHRNHRA